MTKDKFVVLKKYLILGFVIFSISLLTKVLLFQYIIKTNKYYMQPDSVGYICCASSLANGKGMYINNEPVFLRSPGYPAYLALFFKIFGSNNYALLFALLIQIIFCSFIPILIGCLAYLITKSKMAAMLSIIISTGHLGFNLYSCCVHTEGFSILFSVLFLIFLCKSIQTKHTKVFFIYTIIAATLLIIYAWIRPQAIVLQIIMAIIICLISNIATINKFKQIIIFTSLVIIGCAPWCIRNYKLTGQYFMSSSMGATLLSFPAPQVLKRKYNLTISEALKIIYQKAKYELEIKKAEYKKKKSSYVVCKENLATDVALPVLYKNPFTALLVVIKEIIKTALDPFSSQIKKFINNTQNYNPLEETFGEKYKNVFDSSMPWYLQLLCISDFILMILLWIGFFGALYLFGYKFIFHKDKNALFNFIFMSIFTLIPILITGITEGGSRFRITSEPLMIISACLFWIYITGKRL